MDILEGLDRQDRLGGLERLGREDGKDRPVRLDGLGQKDELERQALVEVGDLHFPFRMCYWFSFCDVLEVVPELITNIGVCCYDNAVHVDFSHRALDVTPPLFLNKCVNDSQHFMGR